MNENLPIQNLRQQFVETLNISDQLIVYAPPGSGKSTLVPQFITDHVIGPEKKVMVLQPRRIAARMLANYIARERGSLPGKEVGYQVRLESRKSNETRILFVTEGILMNRLLNGDTLDEFGAIVFDEFHERHLETDISLALAVKLQTVRPLKIVVMSATLDTGLVSRMLGNAVVLQSEGRQFPVTIRYYQPKPYEPVWEAAAESIEAALPEFREGSALVFMPGIHEIRKTTEALQKKSRLQSFGIYPLHGSLSAPEQDDAVSPGGRKIIVTTNVAETSLTIPGVTLVIDSGLARISGFDPRRGLNTLFTEPVSKSSAAQRAGRAGRVAPGGCIRLWSEFSHEFRQENSVPEIHRIDLSELFLSLQAAGEDPFSFPFVEAPAKAALDNAFHTLQRLSAIDANGQITETGLKLAKLNIHPRLARMMVEAEEHRCLPAAALVVAIAQSSGFLMVLNDPVLNQERTERFGNCGSDLIYELNAWLWAGSVSFRQTECSRWGINSGKAREIGRLAVQILQKAAPGHSHLPEQISYEEAEKLRWCIFGGFSDFIAIRHRKNSPTCQMLNGRSGQLNRDSTVQDATYMVVNELEESKTASGIQVILKKVTEANPEWIEAVSQQEWQQNITYQLNRETGRFVSITESVWNGLVIKRQQAEISDHDKAAQIITDAIMNGEIPFPQWDEEVEHFVRRVNFAALHAPHYQIPGINDEAKEFILQQTVYKCRSLKEIQKCNLWPHLKAWLSFEQMGALNVVAPETIELPHRRKPVKLRYDEKGDVILSETIQALYDCPLPITVAEGKVPVIFELLAPSRRPVQITRDLDYFWKNSYQDIKKELKGRYPKHEWR